MVRKDDENDEGVKVSDGLASCDEGVEVSTNSCDVSEVVGDNEGVTVSAKDDEGGNITKDESWKEEMDTSEELAGCDAIKRCMENDEASKD